MNGLFASVAKVLELQPQHKFFQCIFQVDFFRFDWFDLLAVQGTLEESAPAPQFKSISSPVSTFFMGQHSQLYITTGKTIVFTVNICWQSDVSAF